jgi:selenocysteine lyase/cysteine desulfurase
VRDYDFHRDARAFEIGGTANYPGNAALGAALALINEIGSDAITAHVLDLTEELMEGLRRAGATVVTPPERANRSGIVTFTLGRGVAADTACLQKLLDRRILISQRYTAGVGGLRVSVHFFNNREDIERLTTAVQDARRP